MLIISINSQQPPKENEVWILMVQELLASVDVQSRQTIIITNTIPSLYLTFLWTNYKPPLIEKTSTTT